jgi:peptidyl-dipeptidase Dcp
MVGSNNSIGGICSADILSFARYQRPPAKGLSMKCFRIVPTLACLACILAAFPQAPAPPARPAEPPAEASPAFSAENPFFNESILPYHAPPFDKIRNSDYQPAIEEGMKQELADIEMIANNPHSPTFQNTIVPMEKSGALLRRVRPVFSGVTQSNTNPTLQKAQTDLAPKQAAHRDAINLNPKLFDRIRAIYEARNTLSFTPEQKYVIERYYKDFVRSGALLFDADKTTLRAINKEISQLSNEFRKRVLADTNARALVIDEVKLIEGLPESDIDGAAEKAKEKGLTGKWVLALQNTTQQPAMAYLKNRNTREKLFKASSERCISGENDTTAIVSRIAQLRAQRAKLLGYRNLAAYTIDDQMAKAPENAIKLLTDIIPAAIEKAKGEAARMQKLIDDQKAGFKLAPWDWQYYSEQVRKADYDIDEQQVRPYFELDRVVRDGVFFAATKMYGITFKEREDIPVYDPDVKVWEVFDKGGTPMALFYGDYFARSAKAGGAWNSGYVSASRLLGTKPVITNNLNIPKPAPGQPALLTSDQVETLFHEFGHALASLFSTATYSGSMPRDFVEVPSQFNEHWAEEPTVFANYAKHFKTGKVMPKEFVERMKKAQKFNQGFATTEYAAAALIDMEWHMQPADASPQNPAEFEKAALAKYKINLDEVPPRYHTPYFSHIWSGGYSAGYYAYIWSEVIDQDAYYWFRENGGMTRENGQKFRDMILSLGGQQDAAAIYRAFRGRDASVEPLLIERGLKPEPKTRPHATGN